jgi:hypothetical protein
MTTLGNPNTLSSSCRYIPLRVRLPPHRDLVNRAAPRLGREASIPSAIRSVTSSPGTFRMSGSRWEARGIGSRANARYRRVLRPERSRVRTCRWPRIGRSAAAASRQNLPWGRPRPVPGFSISSHRVAKRGFHGSPRSLPAGRRCKVTGVHDLVSECRGNKSTSI